jgi:alkylhydroperoxidase/carboxymuconolactone decarboxylase family protein YurZ
VVGIGLGPDAAMAHQPQVLEATVGLESRVAKRDSLDAEVKELAVMAAAVSRL